MNKIFSFQTVFQFLQIVVWFIVVTSCTGKELLFEGRETGSKQGTARMILTVICMNNNVQYSAEVKDMNDGTISYIITKSTRNVCLDPDGKKKRNVYYIKKCFQGQVYRPAQNDCQGTGNAGNHWGAQTFTFCNTNDNACDNGIGRSVIPAASPAGQSCDSDSTAGKKWGLFYFVHSFLEDKDYETARRTFIALLTEKPSGASIVVWTPLVTSDSSKAYVNLINQDNSITESSQLKNTSNYVLCLNIQEQEI